MKHDSNPRTIEAKSPAEMLDDLRSEMLERIGYAPDERIETDGELYRFDTLKQNDQAGWIVCHVTRFGFVALFGDWREGIPHKWNSFNPQTLNRRELAELKRTQQAQAKARQEEKQRQHIEAQNKAIVMWQSSRPADPQHPYLARKQVGAYGINQLSSLLIPMIDWDGCLRSLQTIGGDGTKRFLKGGRKQGLFCLIGGAWTHPEGVYLCEGYATGASLYEAYQRPVYVGWDAGNLLSVAKAFRARFPNIALTVCADNDRKTPGNPGVTKATEVVNQVPRTSILIPYFPPNAPGELSDFNDLVNFNRANGLKMEVAA